MGTNCSTLSSPHGGVAELVAAASAGDAALCLAILGDRPDLVCKGGLVGRGNTAMHAAVPHLDLLEAIIYFMQTEALATAVGATAASSSQPAGGTAQLCRVQRCLSRVLDCTNNDGQTPLMVACRGGQPEAVRLLLLKGADPWLVDRQGSRTALHHAALAGHAVCIKALLTTVRKTSRYLDTRTICGFSPLHCAVAVSSLEAVRALLMYAPNLYACNVFPPPHFRIRCPVQTTVLHMAAIAGDYEIVKELLKYFLERSAVVTMNDPRRLQDGDHHLPYQVAEARGHHHLVQLLDPQQQLLGEVFRPEDLQVVPGFPLLRMLAATVLRTRLLASLDALAAAAAADSPHARSQPGSPSARRTPCGSSAPHSASLLGPSFAGGALPGAIPSFTTRRPSLDNLAQAFEADEGEPQEDEDDFDSFTAGAAMVDLADDGRGYDEEPAAVAAPRGGGGRGEACGICLDFRQNVSVAGCGHRMCRRCARSLACQVYDRISPCPFCRRPIGDFVAMVGTL